MNTAMQHQRRANRLAVRARAVADRNYWQVGYLDAMVKSPSNPYPLDTAAGKEWQIGYDAGRRELEVKF